MPDKVRTVLASLNRICIRCGKPLPFMAGQRKYCSLKCRNETYREIKLAKNNKKD
jgi:predicted nucleic acid-binding Zn ribbon protein